MKLTHKRQLLFLTLLGNKGYSLKRDLCTPLKPRKKKYEDLEQLLLNYMNPKPNHIKKHYKFKEHKQAKDDCIYNAVCYKSKENDWTLWVQHFLGRLLEGSRNMGNQIATLRSDFIWRKTNVQEMCRTKCCYGISQQGCYQVGP